MNKQKVCIGLYNPKSPNNVSSVMRSCGNFGADAIYFTGTRYPRARDAKSDLAKMSRKVSTNIAVTAVDCLIDAVANDMEIICIELAINATPLPEYKHPLNAFYIFGPEDGTLSRDIVNKADAVVYVPTIGCMNLAATVNVVLYDRSVKRPLLEHGNDLIRKSRDRNNNLNCP